MDLEIYGKEDKSDRIRLALEKDGEDINVIVVDKNGNPEYRGCLLTFDEDGTITMCESVDEDFGFKLNRNGRIELDE